MPETAVSDTGPILHLAEIGEAGRLRLLDAVIVSEQVKAELAALGVWDSASGALSGCLRVEKVTPTEITRQAVTLSAYTVHRPDLSVAVLATRIHPDMVLTDDLRLRRGLESQGHQVVGSVGILVRAFRDGTLAKPELLARVDQLLDGSSLYTSKAFRTVVRESLKNL